MERSIEVNRTKNGTDYVMVSCLENGKRIGGFGGTIKSIKKIMHGGFLGAAGIEALDAYIDEVGRETILQDMRKRAEAKAAASLDF